MPLVLLYLTPLFVLGGLLVALGLIVFLSRYRGGRYLRPIIAWASKVPILKRMIEKASEAAIERYNPELGSAMKKLKRAGADRDPNQAQRALSTLTTEERKAWMEAAGQQGVMDQQPANRAQRRAMERMQKGRMPSPQQKRRAK
jgi:leucyl aminopeptidase (aminopeptidase T)